MVLPSNNPKYVEPWLKLPIYELNCDLFYFEYSQFRLIKLADYQIIVDFLLKYEQVIFGCHLLIKVNNKYEYDAASFSYTPKNKTFAGEDCPDSIKGFLEFIEVCEKANYNNTNKDEIYLDFYLKYLEYQEAV
jgi:hypothetical protein